MMRGGERMYEIEERVGGRRYSIIRSGSSQSLAFRPSGVSPQKLSREPEREADLPDVCLRLGE